MLATATWLLMTARTKGVPLQLARLKYSKLSEMRWSTLHSMAIFLWTRAHVNTIILLALPVYTSLNWSLSYYHRTTFLQLNTIGFLLHFPYSLIPSDLSGSWRNDSNFVSAFLFVDIPPIICCNSPQKVLDCLQFVATLCRIQSPPAVTEQRSQIPFFDAIKAEA